MTMRRLEDRYKTPDYIKWMKNLIPATQLIITKEK